MQRFCERARSALKAACIVCVLAGPMTVEFYATPANAGCTCEEVVVKSVWGMIKSAINWWIENNCGSRPLTDPCHMYG